MERALGRRLSPVLVSGGGSRSDLMMQIVADVFDRPARRTAVNDAAGLGAAICAAVGHGVYPDWDQATAAMVAAGDEFGPDARDVRAYQRINTVYAALTTFTDPLFRSMADGLQGLERALRTRGSGERGRHRGEAQDVLGFGQIGEGDEHGRHAAVSQQPVAPDVLVGRAGVVALGEGGGSSPAAQFLHDRRGILTIAADDRDVEHGHLGLRRVTPGRRAVLAEDGKLAVQRGNVRGKVAAIAEPGRDGQRPLLAAAADDDRDP
jgi:FGGY family of carbohydrate kinases, C-terminal domain